MLRMGGKERYALIPNLWSTMGQKAEKGRREVRRRRLEFRRKRRA